MGGFWRFVRGQLPHYSGVGMLPLGMWIRILVYSIVLAVICVWFINRFARG